MFCQNYKYKVRQNYIRFSRICLDLPGLDNGQACARLFKIFQNFSKFVKIEQNLQELDKITHHTFSCYA